MIFNKKLMFQHRMNSGINSGVNSGVNAGGNPSCDVPASSAVQEASAGTHAVIADLRALLSARFQGAEPEWEAQPAGKTLLTGISEWDAQTQGLRLGEVAEICGGLGGAGLLMDALLDACAMRGWLGAWIDTGDTLEVADWEAQRLRRMLLVRCGEPLEALKAADLLLRDGNASWVVLDLQGVSQGALRRISNSHWHRFHRLVEQRDNALVVLTPSPMVEGARVRVAVGRAWTLDALERPRGTLQREVSAQVFVRGRTPLVAGGRKIA